MLPVRIVSHPPLYCCAALPWVHPPITELEQGQVITMFDSFFQTRHGEERGDTPLEYRQQAAAEKIGRLLEEILRRCHLKGELLEPCSSIGRVHEKKNFKRREGSLL